MPFLPCLNTSTIRPAPLVDKIEAAARAGFRAIEPWNDDVDAYLMQGGTMEALKGLLRERGLAVPSMIAIMGWIGCADADRDAQRAEAVRRIEQAAALGAPHIVASPPGGTVDPDRAARDYREVLQLGKERGILPSMEFLGFVAQINNINAAWEIVQRAGDPDRPVRPSAGPAARRCAADRGASAGARGVPLLPVGSAPRSDGSRAVRVRLPAGSGTGVGVSLRGGPQRVG